MKKLKWEYYTGKLDKDQLEKYNWQPFPFVLKSDITTYLESDEDINKHIAQKVLHDEIITSWCETNSDIAGRYDLASCMGYGTAKHRAGIKEYGLLEGHRRLFMRNILPSSESNKIIKSQSQSLCLIKDD
jgi:hypothetical protein